MCGISEYQGKEVTLAYELIILAFEVMIMLVLTGWWPI